MGYIVIAMPKYGDACRLKDIIHNNGIESDIVLCKGSREVITTIRKYDVSLLICTQTVGSMRYETLSFYLPPTIRVLLLSRENKRDIISDNITNLKIPFKVADLTNTVRTLVCGETGISNKKRHRRSPKDQKVIDNAKLLLMNRDGLSEADAYRRIQKISMDTSTSILETSSRIIALYDKNK